MPKLAATVLRLSVAMSLFCLPSGCRRASDELILDRFDPYAIERDDRDRQLTEVDLGRYFVTQPEIETGTFTVFRSHLVGIVPSRHEWTFRRCLTDHRREMRSRIREVLQAFDVQDHRPESADELKRELVKAVRRSLRTDFISDVVFTDFTVE